MLQGVLDKPVPIVVAVCQGWQELKNGTFNFLGIFDKMFLQRSPAGLLPQSVNLPILTTWTGGRGDFTQVIKVLDEDGGLLLSHPTSFHLANTSMRHNIIALLPVPAAPGKITLTVGRDEEELLRQDFTFEEVGGPPGG